MSSMRSFKMWGHGEEEYDGVISIFGGIRWASSSWTLGFSCFLERQHAKTWASMSKCGCVGKKRPPRTAPLNQPMDFDEIPDDIWISVFEQIDDDPGTLAVLVRACRRFHGLAAKLLLRELRWCKPEPTLRNIEAWAGVYAALVALPRRLTLGIPFDSMRHPPPPLANTTAAAEMRLHDLTYAQLLRFTSITDVAFDGTVLSPYSYSVLAQIPTLRSLRLESCTFIDLPAHPQPPSPLHTLPITHLSLHRVVVPSEYENHRYHPLSLLTIPSLASLSITWTPSIAARYAQNRCPLPSLTHLSVLLPLMSRDLLDELAAFVHRCHLSPRFHLRIDKHNLSDTQMATVQVPSAGLCKYEGPLVVVAGSATRSSLRPTLTHVTINETLELPPLLNGLEMLPAVMEELTVQVGKWDIELLFAIKELFKKIKRLEVRYARGGLPDNLLVRLGADILFCLPDLTSIKLLGPKPLEDANAERSSAGFIGSLPNLGRLHHHHHHHHLHHLGGRPVSHHHHQHLQFHHHQHDDDDDVPDAQTTETDSEYHHHHHHHHGLDEDFEGADTMSEHQDGFPSPGNHHHTGLLIWNAPASSCIPSSPSSSSVLSNTRQHPGVFPFVKRRSLTKPPPPSFSPSPSSSSSSSSSTSSSSSERRPESPPSPPSSPLSQADLGDYLIGWSRYCPSLRVVQIDHRWWWERRFVGDPWVLHVVKYSSSSSSDKGKEREGSFA